MFCCERTALDGELAFRRPALAPRVAGWLTSDHAALLALFLFWCLCNPYFEIDRSSLIYAARAVADLDPAGVGRDIMFRHDGQSGFTLFTAASRAITAVAGVATASAIVALASVFASFAGAVVLAGAIAKGRTHMLAIVFAAALPAFYGGFKIFSYAETAATPRPFTEALVLAGLAALVRGRIGLAVAAMGAAMVLHPIMALAGLGVLIVHLATGERRRILLWVLGIGALGAAGIALALAGVAPFDRLVTRVDPVWQSILVARNPHLFPSLWPDGWVGRAAARIATLVVAATLVPPPVRRLFLATVGVGVAGLAAAYLLNARLPVEAILQAQTWRMMWLVFSLATMAGAVCVMALWPRGGGARIVLALLALGWVYADHDTAAVLMAVTALGLHFGFDEAAHPPSKALTSGVLIGAGLLMIAGLAAGELAPAGLAGEVRHSLAVDWDYTPFAVVAAIAMVAGSARVIRTLLVGVTAVMLVLLPLTWDRRSLANRYFDEGSGAPDLAAMVAGTPGEVLWVGGVRESWWWLGRPQWLTALQGAGLVFSRDLAILYKTRAQRAIEAGLADASVLAPLTASYDEAPRPIDADKVRAFCAAPEAPAWIVAPMFDGAHAPAGLHAMEWTAPVARLDPVGTSDGQIVWRAAQRYAVIACAR